jgi:GDPmannose 4,6-dehydratase
MKKRALICGISGQDGSYLARLLLQKGYDVSGTSRDVQGSTFNNLKKLGIYEKVSLYSMIPEDFRSILVAFRKTNADEIYYLAGQSSVGMSFEQPAETMQSITLGTLNVLEASKMLLKSPKIYFAGSSEQFGDTHGHPAEEGTPFKPRSPYAVSKASAFWLVENYREAYGIFACTGILFNHESPIRSERFVTQKIISAAKRIAAGSNEKLELGRLDISRDWGWSSEFVEAMWLMLQQNNADDYVISTGETNPLELFVEKAFAYFNLNWKDFVVQNEQLMRPNELLVSSGSPKKAKEILKWEAKFKMGDVVKMMIENKY